MYMRSSFWFHCAFLILITADFFAATVTIDGTANHPSFRTIYAFKFSDCFTENRIILDQADIKEDQSFHIEFEVACTEQIFLSINRISAIIYVHPGDHYQVVFPDESHVEYRSFAKSRIPLIIKNQNLTDTITAIDRAISEFVNQHFFEYAYQQYHGPSGYLAEAQRKSPETDIFRMSHDVDSMKMSKMPALIQVFSNFEDEMLNRYSSNEISDYVKKYVRYSLAELELMTLPKLEVYFLKHYTHHRPDLHNVAYARTLRAAFTGFLEKRAQNFLSTQNKNFDLLVTAMDSILPGGSRELFASVWILHLLNNRNLWPSASRNEDLISNEIRKEFMSNVSIITALDGVLKHSSYISPGRLIHQLRLTTGNSELWNLSDAPKAYSYFLFFTEWNTESQKELLLLERLSAKMKGLVSIYAVNCDADFTTFKKFIRQRTKSDVQFLFAGCNPEIDDETGLKMIPDALFLDEDNRTIMPHSPLPSGRLEEYFKQIFDESKKTGQSRKSWRD